jgi:2-keto-4-pentenoate hydratase/2-oxohepta-3-ene-1,7-dioic acid hydratase in catechol pathway
LGERQFPAALLTDGTLLDLGPVLRSLGAHTIPGLLATGEQGLDAVRATIDRGGFSTIDSSAVDFLPPLGTDCLVLATSGNYLSHIQEMGMPPPRNTHSFIKCGSSLVGHRAPIELPVDHGTMVDWEGEFCVVLGRDCHRASPKEADEAIAGYTLLNDISARDWVGAMRSPQPAEATAAWRNNILFKQFPTFGPIGPCIVTEDEIEDPLDLVLTTTLNGEITQRDRVGAMQFTPGEIVSQLSAVYRIRAGDIVTMGTPAGVGLARTPSRFLVNGDHISVSVEGIGALENHVIA